MPSAQGEICLVITKQHVLWLVRLARLWPGAQCELWLVITNKVCSDWLDQPSCAKCSWWDLIGYHKTTRPLIGYIVPAATRHSGWALIGYHKTTRPLIGYQKTSSSSDWLDGCDQEIKVRSDWVSLNKLVLWLVRSAKLWPNPVQAPGSRKEPDKQIEPLYNFYFWFLK